jgi:methionine synthase II (cobalamin-independent)
MFATLLGALPRPPLPDDAPLEALIEAAARAQEAAGLDPVTDGGFRGGVDLVAGWETTQALTTRAVKAVIAGPYSAARSDRSAARSAPERQAETLARAATLNATLRDLAAAGCPLIEVHEPAATSIGGDEAERSLFREAQLRLLDGVEGMHRSLALTGGSADEAGIETILAAPYDSLAVDLIAGPDNWRLVARAPGDRGIVCGALSTQAGSDDGPELLLWAVGYAASTGGRGRLRVGLATASSLADLPWEVAVHKLERLGHAARLVDRPPEERAQALDPRAVSSRSAALGRVEPRPIQGRPDDEGRGPDPT